MYFDLIAKFGTFLSFLSLFLAFLLNVEGLKSTLSAVPPLAARDASVELSKE